MTVMLESFFGLHKAVLDSGLWAAMKPREKDLYIYLCFLSERQCSRELLSVKDEDVATWSGSKPRSITRARKKLQEYGLIRCMKSKGNRYSYIICNPATGQPYPGTPKDSPPKYDSKGLEQVIQRLRPYLQPAPPKEKKKHLRPGNVCPPIAVEPAKPEVYGMPSPFRVANYAD